MDVKKISNRISSGISKMKKAFKSPNGWMNLALLAIIIYIGTQKEINFQFNLQSPLDKANDEQPINMETGDQGKPGIELSDHESEGSSRLTSLASSLLGIRKTTKLKVSYVPELSLADTDNEQVESYIKRFANVATSEQRKFNIPASFILAHALYQSAAGRTDIARNAHNHFMLPCNADWNGLTVEHDERCFHRYNTAWEGYRGHSEYLTIEFPKLKNSNYKGWAKGLERAGHNGDSNFAEQIISIVKKYDLEQFD